MASSQLCAHCRLPLPRRPVSEKSEGLQLDFCCSGCRTVYRLVGGEGGESGWYLAKLALAGILSGNIMMFQALLYFDSYRALGREILQTTSWIMFGLAVAVFLLLGIPMLRSSLIVVSGGRIGMDLLISLGSLAAILASARATFEGSYQTYYDSGTMILVLVTLGAYLDAKSREKATEALERTVDAGRRRARVWREGGEREVAPGEVLPGERILVRAGEEIPTDGIVESGISDVEESALTGESRPRRVEPGDRVFSGSTALDGSLQVVSSGVAETLAARVSRLAEEARALRAPLAIAVDRAAAVFVPAVVAVAAATLLTWGLARGDWRTGGLAGLAVLVVACPCALGLATPLATTLALTRAAARGTIVRSGRALEDLARTSIAAFDKTGTLTVGRPSVLRVELAEGVLASAAAIEAQVTHPFARAIVEKARSLGCTIPSASDVRVIPGGGAEGNVAGTRITVGSRAMFESRGIELPAPAEGVSEVWVAPGGGPLGRLTLTDPVRPEAASVISSLRDRGIRTVLYSGDLGVVAERVAAEVGIERARGGLSPEGKAEAIAGLRKTEGGVVAMIGDGVNDAPALDAADVGIAFGHAADLAREHSAVTVLREDLRAVLELFVLARRTLNTVKGNLVWAFGYNIVGVGLAAAGRLSPIVAALAMVLSSLFVVGNSLRLKRGQMP